MLILTGFNKLVTALRTAVEKGVGTLDKEATSYDDVLDAFRLSLSFGISRSNILLHLKSNKNIL